MGDFSRSFHRPDAGSHTVEGNVSGTRAMMLERKRQAEQEAFEEEKRRKQQKQNNVFFGDKFQPARIGSIEERAFKAKTIGLVSATDFINAAKESSEQQQEHQNEKSKQDKEEAIAKQQAEQAKVLAKKKEKKKKQKKLMASRLSFMGEEEEEEENDEDEEDDKGEDQKESKNASRAIKSKKDPTVDTSFLPDKQREIEQALKRKELEKEWKETQERIQKEALEITYSYWDGSGHRRTCVTTKGATIGEFLETVRQDLCSEFRELTNVAADALMYVKEDLILPLDITFYDLIVTKARGKSGPLFHFDVHEDVRLGPLDSRVEKDESHPGKVVERRWYERNKHIFPASRWELYDPAKDYGQYTIHGGEVNKKKKK